MNKEKWEAAKTARELKENQLNWLDSILLTDDPFDVETHASLVNQITREIVDLNFIIDERKEFLFNWKTGGWNSVWATYKEEAFLAASEMSDTLKPDPDSFRISTPSDYDACLRSFY